MRDNLPNATASISPIARARACAEGPGARMVAKMYGPLRVSRGVESKMMVLDAQLVGGGGELINPSRRRWLHIV